MLGSIKPSSLLRKIISKVKQDFQIPVASHLTLVGSTVDDLRRYLNSAKEQSVDFIVALRGDPPEGENQFQQTAGGLRYANELVELINAEFSNFGVVVAGSPENRLSAN